MKKIFSFLAIIFVLSAIQAQTIEVNSITYNITSSAEPYTVEVTYSTTLTYSGDFVIPSTIEYNSTIYSVTSIGVGAFNACAGLTSIDIPNSVTSIGESAFNDCTGLTSIAIPNSVTSIGDRAFFECTGLISIDVANDNNSYSSIDGVLYNKDVTTLITCPEEKNSILIPSSVETISGNSFWGCNNLSTIGIPNSVKLIDYNAFGYCTGITSIDIPASVESIYYSAFGYNTNLSAINVDLANTYYASLDGILYSKDLSSLISCPAGKHTVDIPNSVDTIEMTAFIGITELSSITIPASMEVIMHYAFYDCTGLTSIVSNAIVPPTLASGLTFNNVLKSIPVYVPGESVAAYQAANYWKDFTNILPIQTVSDIDGNIYNTVRIGDQIWMQENLRTTTYNDGTPIPNVTDNTEWSNLTTGAYSWYDNDEATYKATNGGIYNWYAVDDSRKLCPSGWHVSSNQEWQILREYLGGFDIAGGKLKEAGTEHWSSPNTGATNESGFNAIPAGGRGSNPGDFVYLGTTGQWYATVEDSDPFYNAAYYIQHDNTYLHSTASITRNIGVSVRCVKDSEAAGSFSIEVQDVTVNEGQGLEVPISVSELTAGDNIIAYQFDIDYDNTVIEYSAADLTGTLAEGGTVTVNSSVTGTLNVSYMNSTALVGAGDILILQFNTLKADTTAVTVSNAYLNSTEVNDLTAGTVIIQDITPPTAAITYDDTENRCGDDLLITATFDEPMLSSNAVNINLSGADALVDAEMTRISEMVYTYNYSVPRAVGDVTLSLSNGTDLWSNEVLSTPTSGGSFTITGLTLGDVDDDGKILAYDAALTLQHSVGLDPLPIIDALPWENWRDSTANVDGSAGITANDAGMILQYSAGIIIDFSGSSKKSAPQAFISMAFVDDGIIFYSYGELLGLNVSVDNDFQILEEPIILSDNFMTAFNINDTDYKFGLCTAHPPADGEEILKIPFNRNGAININMIVNDVQKSMALNLTTGIGQSGINEISIYPNPVRDKLNVSGLSSETVARIYSINGQLMLTRNLTNTLEEINVSDLSDGLYIIKLETDKETIVKQFIVH